MAVSRLSPAGGANDFNLSLSGPYTSVTFNKEYASGSYSITSGSSDTTFDIYAYNLDGSLAGYTKSGSFNATKGFNKMVILGGTTSDVLSFTYKTTFITSDDSDEVTAGPVVASVSPSAAPNVDDTFTVTGRNFASDCTVTFTSANTAYSATAAKGIVRTSATSLIVTRPDNLVTTFSPYTITVQNPGVTNPTGSNSHILPNSLTAGASPVWVTGTTLPSFTRNVSYTTTVQATDADAGSAITYSIASGSLPSGFTLASTSGVISGTTTSSTNATVTIRATDSGGNFVDRAFTIPNTGPVWVTTNSSISRPISGQAYSFTLQATDDSGNAPTYTLTSGTLPSGLSLNGTTGVISGTTTDATNRTLVFTATDANGSTSSLTVTNYRALVLTTITITSSQTYTPATNTIPQLLLVGGGGGGGATNQYSQGGGSGGGGGGFVNVLTNKAVVAGQSYNLIIGAGAPNASLSEGNGSRALDGGTTSGFGEQALGGSGGMNCGNGADGPPVGFRGPGGGAASYGFGQSSPWNGPFDQGGPGRACPSNSQGGGGGSWNSNSSTGLDGWNGRTWAFNGQTYGGGGGAGGGGNGGSGGGGTGRSGAGQGFDAGDYGGGGGGIIANQATTVKGGKGFQGIIILQDYA